MKNNFFLHKTISYLYIILHLIYICQEGFNNNTLNILSILMVLTPYSSFIGNPKINKIWYKIFFNSLLNCSWCFVFIHFGLGYMLLLTSIISTSYFIYRCRTFDNDKEYAIKSKDSTYLIIPSWNIFGYNVVCTLLAEIYKIIVFCLVNYRVDPQYIQHFVLYMGFVSNLSVFLTFLHKYKAINDLTFTFLAPFITFILPVLLKIK